MSLWVPLWGRVGERTATFVWRFLWLFRGTFDHCHYSGPVEGSGAHFEEKISRIPPEHAGGLIIGVPDLLGDDGVGNAQGCLPEAVLSIKLCALRGQEFNDIIQP